MADLFKKLNTLVKAKVNDALGDLTSGLPRISGGRNLDQDVAGLRERINQAIEHEDTLQAKIRSQQAEIAGLDQRADEAVKQGNEALARHLIEQMQRVQQRLTMTESDLRAHQLVAQELIQKVNLLEATVADVQRTETQEAVQPALDSNSAADRLSQILSETRDKLSSVGEKVTAAKEATEANLASEIEEPVDDASVDDDLEVRRTRLSKR